MTAEQQYRTAVAALDAAQHHLGQPPRTDPEARAAATRAVEQAVARVREAKDTVKREHEAVVARFDLASPPSSRGPEVYVRKVQP